MSRRDAISGVLAASAGVLAFNGVGDAQTQSPPMAFAGKHVVGSTMTVISARRDGKEAKMVREAKITMAQARKAALGRVNGTVEIAKLKREKGRLLFEFEIIAPTVPR